MTSQRPSGGRPGTGAAAGAEVSRLRQRVWHHAARWLPVVMIALFTYALFPAAQGSEIALFEVGDVSDTEIVAPWDFDVPKSESELQQEADEAAAGVTPIYDFRVDLTDSITAAVDSLFASLDVADTASVMIDSAQRFGLRLTGEEAGYLSEPAKLQMFRRTTRRLVSTYLAAGVAASQTIERESHDEIFLRRGEEGRRMSRDSIMTRATFFAFGADQNPDPDAAVAEQLHSKLLVWAFRPTIVPNEAATERRRDEIRTSIDPIKDHVRANERIVNDHEIVTAVARDRLVALQQEWLDRGGLNDGRLRSAVGQVLTNGIVVTVYWLLLMLYLPRIYGEIRHVMVFSALFGIVIATAAVNHQFIHPGAELMPIPFAALVITVLFNGRIAMVAAIVLAVLLGSQVAYGGQDAFYIALLGGVAAALSVRRIGRRTEILGSVALVSAAFAFAAATVALRVGWSTTEFGLTVVRGVSNATISAGLVFLALPIFEKWARVTTDLSLLELSDPNRPLLRRLATEVPGTYAHSIAMANLCESACNAIGADGLLARVGCYYHDVGKLTKPLHFIENQGVGGNPHDRLPPDVSAAIIRNHVTEGQALAEEHRLPPALRAFIPEHHGTAEIGFFLDRAQKNGPIPEDIQHVFSYPGPKPQSAETAVCMLADGVEAALRVLEDLSPQKLRDAIEYVVQQKIDAGQLNEAPLTLRQLEQVKEEFVHILSGMYHNRVDYPEEAGGITANWGEDARA